MVKQKCEYITTETHVLCYISLFCYQERRCGECRRAFYIGIYINERVLRGISYQPELWEMKIWFVVESEEKTTEPSDSIFNTLFMSFHLIYSIMALQKSERLLQIHTSTGIQKCIIQVSNFARERKTLFSQSQLFSVFITTSFGVYIFHLSTI